MAFQASAGLLSAIREAWAWRGFDPIEIIDLNDFGNAIVRAADGGYWRICPEELTLERVAGSAEELAQLRADPEFETDWSMVALVEAAVVRLGRPANGRCFYLVVPGVLGGAYDADNMRTISLEELHRLTGDLARQIEGLPDGAQIELKVRD